MTNTSISQSQKRTLESLADRFEQKDAASCIFLKSPSDIGVIRNGGRNGARFAPQSLLATFKKFSQTKAFAQLSFKEIVVTSQESERENFELAQETQSTKIAAALNSNPDARVCHIGGGHDHIYPLLKAMTLNKKKIIVINIDAHADTRTDVTPHSGTPFRQFAREFSGDFHLYQVGLNSFANSFSTLNELEKGTQAILWRNDLSTTSLEAFFKQIASKVDESTVVVFSLDADAMTGHEVPGVSAVNPTGLSIQELYLVWQSYQNLPMKHAPIMGIYELNPIYDSLAAISMRTVASFVFRTFDEK